MDWEYENPSGSELAHGLKIFTACCSYYFVYLLNKCFGLILSILSLLFYCIKLSSLFVSQIWHILLAALIYLLKQLLIVTGLAYVPFQDISYTVCLICHYFWIVMVMIMALFHLYLFIISLKTIVRSIIPRIVMYSLLFTLIATSLYDMSQIIQLNATPLNREIIYHRYIDPFMPESHFPDRKPIDHGDYKSIWDFIPTLVYDDPADKTVLNGKTTWDSAQAAADYYQIFEQERDIDYEKRKSEWLKQKQQWLDRKKELDKLEIEFRLPKTYAVNTTSQWLAGIVLEYTMSSCGKLYNTTININANTTLVFINNVMNITNIMKANPSIATLLGLGGYSTCQKEKMPVDFVTAYALWISCVSTGYGEVYIPHYPSEERSNTLLDAIEHPWFNYDERMDHLDKYRWQYKESIRSSLSQIKYVTKRLKNKKTFDSILHLVIHRVQYTVCVHHKQQNTDKKMCHNITNKYS